MARYFSGTSTGNKYEVGRDYVTGDGRVMTAQADGSFVKQGNLVGYTDGGRAVTDNEGRGARSVGSAGNPDVEWYQDRGTSSAHYSAPAAGQSVASAAARGSTYAAESPRASNSGAGVMRIANPSSGVLAGRVAAAAAGGGFLRTGRIAPWSGLDDPEQHYQVAGIHMVASPRSSNMAMVEERQGDAEFLSPAWFASWGIAADDYVHNVSLRAYGPNHQNREYRAAVQKAAIEDFGESVLTWATSSVAGIRKSAAANAAAMATVQDAYNYRDELEAREAMKAGHVQPNRAIGGF
ncbi:MAG: hypothetical protein [Wigfec virus K19_56]|nr:MAG: hypothetical protein [Wigfec virus K19_56]